MLLFLLKKKLDMYTIIVLYSGVKYEKKEK